MSSTLRGLKIDVWVCSAEHEVKAYPFNFQTQHARTPLARGGNRAGLSIYMQQAWRTLGGQRGREAGLRAVGVLHRVDRHHARQDVVIDLHSPTSHLCDAPPLRRFDNPEFLSAQIQTQVNIQGTYGNAAPLVSAKKISPQNKQGARGSGRATCRGCRAPCPAPGRRRGAASACGGRAAGHFLT